MVDQWDFAPSTCFGIRVVSESGRVNLNLNMKDCHHTRLIKNKIAMKEFIPEEIQTLFFQGNVLEDDHTLSSYNIQQGSCIMLALDEELRFYVRVPQDRSFAMFVKTSDTINMIKAKIQDMTKIPTRQQHLLVLDVHNLFQHVEDDRTISEYHIKLSLPTFKLAIFEPEPNATFDVIAAGTWAPSLTQEA